MGNHDDVKNFLPVAVLHNLSKIFESVLLRRMLLFVERSSILSPTQFGFRKGFSTKDAVFFLFTLLENIKIQNRKSCVIQLDLSKAFDTVSHDKLISILTSLGFRGHFTKIIISFLSNRKFQIRCNDKYSNYMKICTGVPQGASPQII